MIEPGPWLLVVADKTALVFAYEAHDGGMVEFVDAVTDEFRGCAGIHWWQEERHRVRYDGPLPMKPEEGRWIT